MNLRQLLFVCLLSSPFLGISQTLPSFGFVTGASVNHRFLTAEEKDNIILNPIGMPSAFEEVVSPNTGFRFGVDVNFPLSSKLVFHTGFRIARLGTRETYFGVAERISSFYSSYLESLTSSFIPELFGMQPIHLVKNHYYLELPLIVRIEPSQKTIAPFFSLGLSPHFYMETVIAKHYQNPPWSDRSTYVEKEKSFDRQKYRTISTAGIFALGMNANIKRNQFFVQHIVRYHFNGLERDKDAQDNLNVGIELGLRRKLSDE